MIELEADHSHLYPGATGCVLSGDPGKGGAAVVRFADGGAAEGTLAGGLLRLAPYTTAAGTRIGARGWQLAVGTPAPGRFRVTARAPAS